MTRTILIISLLAGFSWIGITNGCKPCAPSHPHKQFCRAAFVIKGRICGLYMKPFRHGHGFMESKRYTVAILEVFKGHFDKKRIHLYSPGIKRKCGVNLNLGQVFLLSGYVDKKNRYRINTCNWSSKFSELSSGQDVFLRTGLYAKNCPCGRKIKTCTGNTPTSQNVCNWNTATKHGQCLRWNAFCECSKDGCHWKYGNTKC